jgi:AcrR family transcriptional regulator
MDLEVLDRPSEVNDTGKRRQILDGARRVFLASGFDAASMNEIARTAGVSKGTLYVYFDSKEALFASLLRHDKRAQVEQLCQFSADHVDLRAALLDMGVRLLTAMLAPDRIAQFRTVIAVSARFPEIGQAFYEAGPEYGRAALADFLRERARAAGLEIDNHEVAAEQLLDLCKSHLMLRAVLNVEPAPDAAMIESCVRDAVDTFLRAYRPA